MYGPTANLARILPALVDQMLDHRYSEADCHKILGGNIIRVFEKVWGGSDVAIDDKPVLHEDWR